MSTFFATFLRFRLHPSWHICQLVASPLGFLIKAFCPLVVYLSASRSRLTMTPAKAGALTAWIMVLFLAQGLAHTCTLSVDK